MESFNLFSSDLNSINKSIEYYNKTIEHFKRTYYLSDGNTFNRTSTSTARKDRPTIEKTLKLKIPYKKPLVSKIGFNFISTIEHEGLPKIKINDFSKRSEMERKKFFKSTPTKSSSFLDNLSEKDKNSFIDLETNRFKHFSPSKVFFGGKSVDTTSLNPESMEVNFFNNLKFSREMISRNNEEDFSIIDREEEQSLYTDSREYLGGSTKFNNAVLGVLRRNPTKLSKIRKEFRLLDRAILTKKKSKISLDSFDLSSKNNIIKKTISSQPKEIPMQIKALSLLKTEATNFNVNNLDFDPLSNPQTDEVIKQNFLNIGKVEMLGGFERVNGIPMMNKPIYKEITPKEFEDLKTKNVLCRINNNNFDNLTIDDSRNFQIFDKVFILESTEEDVIDTQDRQPISSTEDQLIEIFVETILSPVFYSSNIVTQNRDNASTVEALRVIGDELRPEGTPPRQASATPTETIY